MIRLLCHRRAAAQTAKLTLSVSAELEHTPDRHDEIRNRLEDARRRSEAAQKRRERVASIALAFTRESHENHFVERLQMLHDDARLRLRDLARHEEDRS